MKVKIDVTEEDILNGKPGKATKCPIALAVCRALNIDVEEEAVIVSGNEIIIDHEVQLMPVVAAAFMDDYDFKFPSGTIRPFSFEIEKP